MPLILTISPLLALYEALLKKRARGPLEDSKRRLRFTILGAHGLRRPRTEIDHYTAEQLQELIEDKIYKESDLAAIRAPSPFAVLTIDGINFFTTYDQLETPDPEWRESFDATVSDTTTIVVRVFDLKCLDRGWPALMGYTTILPFSMIPPAASSHDPVAPSDLPEKSSRASTPRPDLPDTGVLETALAVVPSGGGRVGVKELVQEWSFPLVLDRSVVPGSSVELAVSVDLSKPPPPPKIPGHYAGWKKTNERVKTSIVKWRGKTVGGKRRTVLTETYNLNDDV